MNENTSLTKCFFFNSLNARTDHGVRLNKLRHKTVDDVKVNTKQRHLNGDTVQDVVLLQNRKFRQTRSNLVSTCFSRPN